MCKEVHCYEQAMAHFDKCEFILQPCRQGCGLGILGKDMDFHCDKQCSEKKIICETCEEAIYPNRVGEAPHDCMSVMKKNLKEAREEIASLKAMLGGG